MARSHFDSLLIQHVQPKLASLDYCRIWSRAGRKRPRPWCKILLVNHKAMTAQIAVAAGEADLAVVNHYYYAKMLASDDPAEQAAAAKVKVHFPGQLDQSGAHANISGAAMLKHAQENRSQSLPRIPREQRRPRAIREAKLGIPRSRWGCGTIRHVPGILCQRPGRCRRPGHI